MFNILLFFLCVQIKLFHCHCHCHCHYEIGIELICNTGNANLYNFGRKATQYDFRALKFKSISINTC